MSSVDRMVTCKECGSEHEWLSNCKTCDKKRREEQDMARANQAAALLGLGFSEPFHAGGMFSPEFASCLTCGAAVVLSYPQEGQTHPLELHKAWHDAQ